MTSFTKMGILKLDNTLNGFLFALLNTLNSLRHVTKIDQPIIFQIKYPEYRNFGPQTFSVPSDDRFVERKLAYEVNFYHLKCSSFS